METQIQTQTVSRPLELPEGRFVMVASVQEESVSIRTFYACGSCGGVGCGACGGRGVTQEVQPDQSASLAQEVHRFKLQFDLARAVCKGVRADVDIEVFPANVRRSIAERVARFVVGEFGIFDDRGMCTVLASLFFGSEPETVRSNAEVEASRIEQASKEEAKKLGGDDGS